MAAQRSAVVPYSAPNYAARFAWLGDGANANLLEALRTVEPSERAAFVLWLRQLADQWSKLAARRERATQSLEDLLAAHQRDVRPLSELVEVRGGAYLEALIAMPSNQAPAQRVLALLEVLAAAARPLGEQLWDALSAGGPAASVAAVVPLRQLDLAPLSAAASREANVWDAKIQELQTQLAAITTQLTLAGSVGPSKEQVRTLNELRLRINQLATKVGVATRVPLIDARTAAAHVGLAPAATPDSTLAQVLLSVQAAVNAGNTEAARLQAQIQTYVSEMPNQIAGVQNIQAFFAWLDAQTRVWNDEVVTALPKSMRTMIAPVYQRMSDGSRQRNMAVAATRQSIERLDAPPSTGDLPTRLGKALRWVTQIDAQLNLVQHIALQLAEVEAQFRALSPESDQGSLERAAQSAQVLAQLNTAAKQLERDWNQRVIGNRGFGEFDLSRGGAAASPSVVRIGKISAPDLTAVATLDAYLAQLREMNERVQAQRLALATVLPNPAAPAIQRNLAAAQEARTGALQLVERYRDFNAQLTAIGKTYARILSMLDKDTLPALGLHPDPKPPALGNTASILAYTDRSTRWLAEVTRSIDYLRTNLETLALARNAFAVPHALRGEALAVLDALNVRTRSLDDSRTLLATRTAELATITADIATRNTEVRAARQKQQEAQAELVAVQQAAANAERDVRTAQGILREHRGVLEGAGTTIADIKQQVADKAQTLSSLRAQSTAATSAIADAQLRASVAERDRRIATLEAQLAECQDALRACTKNLSAQGGSANSALVAASAQFQAVQEQLRQCQEVRDASAAALLNERTAAQQASERTAVQLAELSEQAALYSDNEARYTHIVRALRRAYFDMIDVTLAQTDERLSHLDGIAFDDWLDSSAWQAHPNAIAQLQQNVQGWRDAVARRQASPEAGADSHETLALLYRLHLAIYQVCEAAMLHVEVAAPNLRHWGEALRKQLGDLMSALRAQLARSTDNVRAVEDRRVEIRVHAGRIVGHAVLPGGAPALEQIDWLQRLVNVLGHFDQTVDLYSQLHTLLTTNGRPLRRLHRHDDADDSDAAPEPPRKGVPRTQPASALIDAPLMQLTLDDAY